MPNTTPLLKALGTAIREQRREQRLSQEALGLETGVHRNYLGGVERGEREPTVSTIAKLAQSLNCELSDLFRRAESLMATSEPE